MVTEKILQKKKVKGNYSFLSFHPVKRMLTKLSPFQLATSTKCQASLAEDRFIDKRQEEMQSKQNTKYTTNFSNPDLFGGSKNISDQIIELRYAIRFQAVQSSSFACLPAAKEGKKYTRVLSFDDDSATKEGLVSQRTSHLRGFVKEGRRFVLRSSKHSFNSKARDRKAKKKEEARLNKSSTHFQQKKKPPQGNAESSKNTFSILPSTFLAWSSLAKAKLGYQNAALKARSVQASISNGAKQFSLPKARQLFLSRSLVECLKGVIPQTSIYYFTFYSTVLLFALSTITQKQKVDWFVSFSRGKMPGLHLSSPQSSWECFEAITTQYVKRDPSIVLNTVDFYKDHFFVTFPTLWEKQFSKSFVGVFQASQKHNANSDKVKLHFSPCLLQSKAKARESSEQKQKIGEAIPLTQYVSFAEQQTLLPKMVKKSFTPFSFSLESSTGAEHMNSVPKLLFTNVSKKDLVASLPSTSVLLMPTSLSKSRVSVSQRNKTSPLAAEKQRLKKREEKGKQNLSKKNKKVKQSLLKSKTRVKLNLRKRKNTLILRYKIEASVPPERIYQKDLSVFQSLRNINASRKALVGISLSKVNFVRKALRRTESRLATNANKNSFGDPQAQFRIERPYQSLFRNLSTAKTEEKGLLLREARRRLGGTTCRFSKLAPAVRFRTLDAHIREARRSFIGNEMTSLERRVPINGTDSNSKLSLKEKENRNVCLAFKTNLDSIPSKMASFHSNLSYNLQNKNCSESSLQSKSFVDKNKKEARASLVSLKKVRNLENQNSDREGNTNTKEKKASSSSGSKIVARANLVAVRQADLRSSEIQKAKLDQRQSEMKKQNSITKSFDEETSFTDKALSERDLAKHDHKNLPAAPHTEEEASIDIGTSLSDSKFPAGTSLLSRFAEEERRSAEEESSTGKKKKEKRNRIPLFCAHNILKSAFYKYGILSNFPDLKENEEEKERLALGDSYDLFSNQAEDLCLSLQIENTNGQNLTSSDSKLAALASSEVQQGGTTSFESDALADNAKQTEEGETDFGENKVSVLQVPPSSVGKLAAGASLPTMEENGVCRSTAEAEERKLESSFDSPSSTLLLLSSKAQELASTDTNFVQEEKEKAEQKQKDILEHTNLDSIFSPYVFETQNEEMNISSRFMSGYTFSELDKRLISNPFLQIFPQNSSPKLNCFSEALPQLVSSLKRQKTKLFGKQSKLFSQSKVSIKVPPALPFAHSLFTGKASTLVKRSQKELFFSQKMFPVSAYKSVRNWNSKEEERLPEKRLQKGKKRTKAQLDFLKTQKRDKLQLQFVRAKLGRSDLLNNFGGSEEGKSALALPHKLMTSESVIPSSTVNEAKLSVSRNRAFCRQQEQKQQLRKDSAQEAVRSYQYRQLKLTELKELKKLFAKYSKCKTPFESKLLNLRATSPSTFSSRLALVVPPSLLKLTISKLAKNESVNNDKLCKERRKLSPKEDSMIDKSFLPLLEMPFTSYSNYLSRPKDSLPAITLSPSLEEDKAIENESIEMKSKGDDKGKNKEAKEALLEKELELQQSEALIEAENQGEEIKAEILPSLITKPASLNKSSAKLPAIPENRSNLSLSFSAEELSFTDTDADSDTDYIEPGNLEAIEQKEKKEQEKKKEEELTKFEFLSQIREIEHSFEKAKDLRKLAYPYKLAFSPSLAAGNEKSEAKRQNFGGRFEVDKREDEKSSGKRYNSRECFSFANKESVLPYRAYQKVLLLGENSERFVCHCMLPVNKLRFFPLSPLFPVNKGGLVKEELLQKKALLEAPKSRQAVPLRRTALLKNRVRQKRGKRSFLKASMNDALFNPKIFVNQNLPVYDRKHSFFGITNLLPKRLVAQDQKLINDQILEDNLATQFCTQSKVKARLEALQEKRGLQKSSLASDPIDTLTLSKSFTHHPIHKPSLRLRLNELNELEEQDDEIEDQTYPHRWWQKRQIESSLLAAPSKRYMVMPHITQNDWRKILEWQLKSYLFEETTRLRELPSSSQLHSLKIQKIFLYLPWVSLKKSKSKAFQWPLTRFHKKARSASLPTRFRIPLLKKESKARKSKAYLLAKENKRKDAQKVLQRKTKRIPLRQKDLPFKVQYKQKENAERSFYPKLGTVKLPHFVSADRFLKVAKFRLFVPNWKLDYCFISPYSQALYSKSLSVCEADKVCSASQSQAMLANPPTEISKAFIQGKGVNQNSRQVKEQNTVHTVYLFEPLTRYSYLLLNQLLLAFFVKHLFQYISRLFDKSFSKTLKESSLFLAISPFLFKNEASSHKFYNITKWKDASNGADNRIAECQDVIWYLRNSCRARRAIRGLILVGNTESTALVKAIAGEAQVPIVVQSLKTLSLTENNAQLSLEKVLMLAEKKAPCVLFLDDLDAIGEARSELLEHAFSHRRRAALFKKRKASFFTDFNETGAEQSEHSQVSPLQRQSTQCFKCSRSLSMKFHNWVVGDLISKRSDRSSPFSKKLSFLGIDTSKSFSQLAESPFSLTDTQKGFESSVQKPNQGNTNLLRLLCTKRSRKQGILQNQAQQNSFSSGSKLAELTSLAGGKGGRGSLGKTNLSPSANKTKRGRTSSTVFQSSVDPNSLERKRIELMLRVLTVMDGLTHLNGFVIITTSQKPSLLDPALLRPGRFEKLVDLKLPNKKTRIELLKVESKKIGHTSQMPWDYLARRTASMNVADITRVIKHSTFRAILQETGHTLKTLEAGIHRVKGNSFEFDSVAESEIEQLPSKQKAEKLFAVFEKREKTKQTEKRFEKVLLPNKGLKGKQSFTTMRCSQDKTIGTNVEKQNCKIAFHQAGKAVLQNLLFQDPENSLLQKDAQQNALPNFHSPKACTRSTKLFRKLVALYAGSASESLYTTCSIPDSEFASKCTDLQKALPTESKSKALYKDLLPKLLTQTACFSTHSYTHKNAVAILPSATSPAVLRLGRRRKTQGRFDLASVQQSSLGYLQQLQATSLARSIADTESLYFYRSAYKKESFLAQKFDSNKKCVHRKASPLYKSAFNKNDKLSRRKLCFLTADAEKWQSSNLSEDLSNPIAIFNEIPNFSIQLNKRRSLETDILQNKCLLTNERSFVCLSKNQKDSLVNQHRYPANLFALQSGRELFWEEKVCGSLQLVKRSYGNWYRLYRSKIKQSKKSQEWFAPDQFVNSLFHSPRSRNPAFASSAFGCSALFSTLSAEQLNTFELVKSQEKQGSKVNLSISSDSKLATALRRSLRPRFEEGGKRSEGIQKVSVVSEAALENSVLALFDTDKIYYNIIISCFYTAFNACSENRELLDLLADHFIRFKILRLHEMVRIVSVYLSFTD